MTKPCDGALLVEMLRKELHCENKNQLAKKLGKPAASINAWADLPTLTKAVVRNVIGAVRDAAIRSAIEPILEFRQLDHFHGHAADTLRKKIADKDVCTKLMKSRGIYSFYDSNGRVIYVGKTEKTNLLVEMTQAFKLTRKNYTRKLANKNGKFSVNTLAIRDTAEFVSAYSVDVNAIGNVEALLTRMIPNDIVNKKTENFRLG